MFCSWNILKFSQPQVSGAQRVPVLRRLLVKQEIQNTGCIHYGSGHPTPLCPGAFLDRMNQSLVVCYSTAIDWSKHQLMLCRSRAGGLIYSGRELISQLFYSWSSCNCAAARYWLVGTAGTTFWSLLLFHCQDLLTYFAWLLDTSSVFSLIHCFGFKVCSALLSFANPKTDTCHQLQPM